MSRASLLVAVITASCASQPPSAVDEEHLLVDLETCARGEVLCVRSGDVQPAEVLVPGAHGVTLRGTPGNPARISLPLRRPGDAARLVWITVGLNASELKRTLSVRVTGAPATTVQPAWGWARAEVAAGELVPEANARVELVVEEGTFTLAWVVGRWKT